MFAKRFFYVCAGLLCLAVAYHLGAVNAKAAPTATAIGISQYGGINNSAITSNGDVYSDGSTAGRTWSKVGNIFGTP